MGGLQVAKHPGGTAKQNRAQILVLDQGARHEVCKGAHLRLVQTLPLRSLEAQQRRNGVKADGEHAVTPGSAACHPIGYVSWRTCRSL